MGKLPEASVTDWEIDSVRARVVRAGGGDPTEQRFLFEVKVSRRYTFFVWRVLLPMTLLVIASWTVFWFEPGNLQPQISTGLAILLSLVTFTYAIDFSLPKVAYLTFIDRYTLTAFAFVLAAIFAVSTIHVLLDRGGDRPGHEPPMPGPGRLPAGLFRGRPRGLRPGISLKSLPAGSSGSCRAKLETGPIKLLQCLLGGYGTQIDLRPSVGRSMWLEQRQQGVEIEWLGEMMVEVLVDHQAPARGPCDTPRCR